MDFPENEGNNSRVSLLLRRGKTSLPGGNASICIFLVAVLVVSLPSYFSIPGNFSFLSLLPPNTKIVIFLFRWFLAER